MPEVLAAKVRQLLVLEMLPEAFGWIQIRGVAGEKLRLQHSEADLMYEQLDDFRTMNGRAVPDDPKLPEAFE